MGEGWFACDCRFEVLLSGLWLLSFCGASSINDSLYPSLIALIPF